MSRLGRVSWVFASILCLSACGPTFTSLPLPGSGVSGKTITVNADFANALNLDQGAAVSINGVTSGRVKSVTVSDFTAHVTMFVQTAADLRSDASVRLRYTTPLGELYVEVTNPASGPLMANDGTLGLNQTSTAPTVEDALASASLLINGGGLNQLQTIISESNKALSGNEGDIRSLINQAANSAAQVYAAGSDITKSLDALNAVSQGLAARRQIIHSALADIAPAAEALHANTANFAKLLASLDRFANTASGVVTGNRAALLRIIDHAQPVLQEMVDVRGQLAPALNAILSLSKSLNTAIPGDYLNLFLKLDLTSSAAPKSAAAAPVRVRQPGHAGSTSKSGTLAGLAGIPIIGGLL